MSFSLIWLISYEFLTGKGDDMCINIVKEEHFTVDSRYLDPAYLE